MGLSSKLEDAFGGSERSLRRAERGREVEDIVKITNVVVVSFLHKLVVDHGENNATEIARADNSPVSKHGFRQEPIFFNSVIAKSPAELLAGHMAGVFRLRARIAMNLLNGVVEAVADKLKRFDGVTAAFFDDLLKGFARGLIHRHKVCSAFKIGLIIQNA